MFHIITTTQLQKKIGTISKNIGQKTYIVTGRGVAKMVILPYFEGCDDFIDDYMEEFEILKNKDKLEAEIRESIKSGPSKLVI